MPSFEFPTHIHLHPHATVADYEGVNQLAQSPDEPFLIFLPEAPDSSVISELQLISDGNKALHRKYQQRDKKNRQYGVSTDMNFARGRALSEALFNTGLVVVSVHPAWDEKSAASNSVALGKDHRLKPTFQEAIGALKDELPPVARVIAKRDSFTANNFLRILNSSTRSNPDFAGLSTIPCLMEIGSLHFQLADKLASKGVEVTMSGDDTIDKLPGAYERGIAHLLMGGQTSDLDLERIAFEDALSNDIWTTSTAEKQKLVDRIILSKDRKDWAKSYEMVAGVVNSR